jgi:hypothetical protein
MEGLVHYFFNVLEGCLGLDQRHDVGLVTQGTPYLMLAPHQLLNKEINPVHLCTM